MIVTLAGHVDHGKTSLVRALTGVDTDRLDEEKQRGLTIDLGFAYIDEGRIGFVDVPGHHRFIHNMVAGVAQDQHALLVIAADDGPMPQSREHLDILSLVGIKSGAIVLTKTDRVDSQRLQSCREEIKALVAGTFLQDAPLFETSLEDNTSYPPLLEHLRGVSLSSQATHHTPFRLAIDRAFSVKGVGLVVTGTAHCGEITIDSTLYHFPSNKQVRVRGVRAQDRSVTSAHAGERCALNLSGLELDEVTRGDWLSAQPPAFYKQASVELSVLRDFPRAVKHWTPVHIYHATSHTTARIALLDDEHIQPGDTATVDLVLDNPLPLVHGDALIVRDQSLDVTLGGARVVYAELSPTQRRRDTERQDYLTCFLAQTPQQCLEQVTKKYPVDLQAFRQLWNLDPQELEQMVTALEIQQFGEVGISKAYWFSLIRDTYAQVQSHQKTNPTSAGLRENEFLGVPANLLSHVLNALVQAGKLQNSGGYYQLPQHQAELPPALEKSWQRLQNILDVKQAPSTGDLAKTWNTPQQQIEADLKELTKRGLVIHVANHRFYLPKQLQDLSRDVKQLAANKPFSVKEFRDTTGIGRNVAIEVLEYFDRRGFTRRQGNERIVLKESL